MKSKYTSNELFHFVGYRAPDDHEANYQIVLKILEDGCVSHPPHVSGWGTVKVTTELTRPLISEEMIVPTMTSYADICFDHLALHGRKYGMFAVSFKRELLVKYGARPVIYVPHSASDGRSIFGSEMLKDIDDVYRGFRENLVEPNKDLLSKTRDLGERPRTPEATIAALDAVLQTCILTFVKPFNADLADDDPRNVYLEREWRKHGNLVFFPSTLESVVVAPGFDDRLRKDAPPFASKVKIFPV